MTLSELVSLLDATPRGAKWVAKCPAHADTSPSLQIREGEKGILLKCWAGCTFMEICVALSIKPHDLFFDGTRPDMDELARKKRRALVAQMAKARLIDACREADRTIRAATGVDISGWTDEQVDAALEAVCQARTVLEHDPYA